VSLTPAITSILATLGHENQVIATTENDFFIRKNSVGSIIRFSLEKILSLNPDIVFYQRFQKSWIEPILRFKNIRFVEIPLTDTQSIFEAAQRASDVLNISWNKISGKIRTFQKKFQSPPPVQFHYIAIVDRDTEFRRYFAAGTNSYLSSLLSLLGGKNAVPLEKDYIQLSESFFMRVPEKTLILDFSPRTEIPERYRKMNIISLPDPRMTIPDLRFEEKLRILRKAVGPFLK
jgi:ABC-type hemin transport system substrate-binding protein